MSNSIAPNDPRTLLAAHAKTFYDRGWMWGTAGNLSAKLSDGSFWITASGCSKGELTPEQFVRMSLDGNLLERPIPQAQPSAETSIHQAVYGLFPEVQACYHVHSVPANLVSRLSTTPQILLPAIEMIKGMGIWDENPQVFLDIFPNHAQVSKIADEMRDRFHQSLPQIPACLIQDHGVTVWGASQAEARNRLEVMEFIFQYAIAVQSIDLQRGLG
jgi:methylthioribulose-1-phosphate dehydratase